MPAFNDSPEFRRNEDLQEVCRILNKYGCHEYDSHEETVAYIIPESVYHQIHDDFVRWQIEIQAYPNIDGHVTLYICDDEYIETMVINGLKFVGMRHFANEHDEPDKVVAIDTDLCWKEISSIVKSSNPRMPNPRCMQVYFTDESDCLRVLWLLNSLGLDDDRIRYAEVTGNKPYETMCHLLIENPMVIAGITCGGDITQQKSSISRIIALKELLHELKNTSVCSAVYYRDKDELWIGHKSSDDFLMIINLLYSLGVAESEVQIQPRISAGFHIMRIDNSRNAIAELLYANGTLIKNSDDLERTYPEELRAR